MATLFLYKIYTDEVTTKKIVFPDQIIEQISVELATIDGLTYVSLPDGTTLPDNQPPEIVNSIKPAILTPELKDAIKSASPHVRLIATRVIEKIRERYTVDDELYYGRIGIGAAMKLYTPTADEMQQLIDFGVFVEEARQWGRAQRALLGL